MECFKCSAVNGHSCLATQSKQRCPFKDGQGSCFAISYTLTNDDIGHSEMSTVFMKGCTKVRSNCKILCPEADLQSDEGENCKVQISA